MNKFTIHKGLVAPMDRDNVDTDAIIPKQFLKSIKRSGLATCERRLGNTQRQEQQEGPLHVNPCLAHRLILLLR